MKNMGMALFGILFRMFDDDPACVKLPVKRKSQSRFSWAVPLGQLR